MCMRCGANVGKSHLNEKCNSLIVSELHWLFRDSVGKIKYENLPHTLFARKVTLKQV